MIGFKLENGDIVIGKKSGNTISPRGNQIQLVKDNELLAQKFLIVLGTNIGEWFWNENLGINYDFIIGKGITEDMIRSQIEVGIHQVDPNMFLSDFKVNFNKAKRTANITFIVEDSGGKIAKIEKIYGAETSADLESRLEAANAKITVYETATARLAQRLAQSRP